MINLQRHLFLSFVLTVAISLILLIHIEKSFAVEYKNYTSEKFGIQISYPSDYDVLEKVSYYDINGITSIQSDYDIKILDGFYAADFLVTHSDMNLEPTLEFTGIINATSQLLKMVSDEFSRNNANFNVIANPSLTTIDNYDTGTFSFSSDTITMQLWLTFVGNNSYVFTYPDTSDSFNKEESLNLRNNYINSIVFLPSTNGELDQINKVFKSVKDACDRNEKKVRSFIPDFQIKNFFEEMDELDDELYSLSYGQSSLDRCIEGIAWLKIECDINYEQSELCRENMPALKTFLERRNMDDRDSKYFHDKFENRKYDKVN